MPRTSAVDQLGVGDRVMQLAIVEHKSVPTVIEIIADETGVVLSDDMVRNWLRVQPAEIIEKAERIGLAKDLKPLLDYAGQTTKVMDRIQTLVDKLGEHIDGAGLESDSAFIMGLAEELGVPAKTVQAIVGRTQREHMAPKLMSLLVRSLDAARKMLETAHKLDPSARGVSARGAGPATGRPIFQAKTMNFVTPDDLQTIMAEAKARARAPAERA